MLKKLFILFVSSCISFSYVAAQELNCNLTINAEKITGANKQLFQTLQRALGEFINNHRWTDMQYQQNEKIECSFMVIVNEQIDEKTFKGSLQIQARRPVYNSGYYTSLFSFMDENFNFEYIEHSLIEYVDGSFSSNLTSMIAYYCYVILGYDCDSYARMSGTPMFRKAESIVNLAQSQNQAGWKAFEDSRNRYALINNLLDDNLRKFREFYYDYHRLGLDEMSVNLEKGRAKMSSSMPLLQDANRARPSCVALTSFLEAKREEMINIFSKGTPAEKKTVYDILLAIDASRSADYDKILKN